MRNTTTDVESLKNEALNTFNQSAPLTEKVKLITKGLVPKVPANVTLKAIQRKDKKKVLLSDADDMLLALLQNAIVHPTSFNVFDLLPFESEYLLYRLKVLTYGNEHTFNEVCPHCGKTNSVTINLNDIPIEPVPDDFKTVFDIPPLPVSGDVITCKMLTEGENIAIQNEIKKMQEATGNDQFDIDILWEYRIVAINGNNKIAPIEITQYLDNLSDYDSEYFMAYYTDKLGNYGLQKNISYTCDNCGKIVSKDLPSIYTFFRPTFTFDRA